MLTLNQAKSRVIAYVHLDYIDRVIHRTVVYYQVLKIMKCLPQYRIDGFTDVFGDVVGGRHDRNNRWTSLIGSGHVLKLLNSDELNSHRI